METTTIIFIWLVVLTLFVVVSVAVVSRLVGGLIECVRSLVYACKAQSAATQKVVQVLRQEGNLLRGGRDLNGLKQRLEDAAGQIKTYPEFDDSGGPHGH